MSRLLADDVLDEMTRRGVVTSPAVREAFGLVLELFVAGAAARLGAEKTSADLGLGLGRRVARLIEASGAELRSLPPTLGCVGRPTPKRTKQRKKSRSKGRTVPIASTIGGSPRRRKAQ